MFLFLCRFTRAPVFRSKHTLQWSSKMLKTELKPFLTILGTRMHAKPQDKRHSLRQEILFSQVDQQHSPLYTIGYFQGC
jgi:hypothetical protein